MLTVPELITGGARICVPDSLLRSMRSQPARPVEAFPRGAVGSSSAPRPRPRRHPWSFARAIVLRAGSALPGISKKLLFSVVLVPVRSVK